MGGYGWVGGMTLGGLSERARGAHTERTTLPPPPPHTRPPHQKKEVTFNSSTQQAPALPPPCLSQPTHPPTPPTRTGKMPSALAIVSSVKALCGARTRARMATSLSVSSCLLIICACSGLRGVGGWVGGWVGWVEGIMEGMREARSLSLALSSRSDSTQRFRPNPSTPTHPNNPQREHSTHTAT